ncbi:hypothetical protein EVJ58_g1750 [Rhodofomes roseus]|uniref:Uncharacterized protein n=1 Tax=Rhodofomes roseus TaxID=34475 RepID=A0A4Y9YZN3_9APHY|nr:hypothetical protein EVJ58_g1750 [Rhodofomes roseus]
MASVADTPTTSSSSPELLALQEKLKALSEVNAQLRTVRRIPTQLVKPPEVGILQQLSFDTTPAEKFQLVKDLADAISSERVQSSLSAARASEQKGKGDLVFTKPREARKRKRQPSPESPRVHVFETPKRTSHFPADDAPPLKLDGLVDYLKDFNRANPKGKVHIVTSLPQQKLACPLVLRFAIQADPASGENAAVRTTSLSSSNLGTPDLV